MALTLEKILLAASDQRTYHKGLQYYYDQNIKKYQANHTEDGKEINAVVQGKKPYNVSVRLDEQEEFRSAHCSCPTYSKKSGACKHIVAVLIHQYHGKNASSVQNKPKPNDFDKHMDEENNLKKTGSLHNRDGLISKRPTSDGVARLMMNKYTMRENAEVVGQSFSDTEKVTLTPIVRQSKDDVTLVEFTIGKSRQYVVRNVFELVENVKSLNKVSYGKQLEFIHSIDSFNEKSKQLMLFIMEKCDEVRLMVRAYGNINLRQSNMDKRFLRLSPYALDRLISMYIGEKITASLGSEIERLATVVTENPELKISVEDQGDGTILFTAEKFGLAAGEKHIYIQLGDYIYRCDEDLSDRARDFLKALEKCSFRMRIAKNDLSRFCANVYPVVKNCFVFTGDTGTLIEYMPLPLETEIFIDAPGKNVITARMIYRYGDKTFDYYALHFAGKSPEIERRDLRSEMVVRVIISKYIRLYDTNRKVLLLEADDEEIYRFISEGIPALMEVATVHISDRMQRIGIATAPQVSIGVRMVSNLLELKIEPGEFPAEELLNALNAYRENRKFYRLSDGRYLRLEDNALNALAQLADGLELTDRQLQSGEVVVPRYRALYLDRVLRENDEIRVNRDTYFKDLIRNIKSVEDSDLAVPESLAGILRNYQKTGYRWLKTLAKYNLGGILADDMGLGKTLQVIALFLSAKEEKAGKPSLVVTPASLAINWENEIRRFAPSLNVATVIGDNAERKEIIDEAGKYDVLITSYDMLKRDIEHYEGKEFLYQIIDEAQYIKNHSTQNARSVKAIRSDHRLALTGTPIENRLSELWSIFDYLMPGYLYSYQKFKKRFEIPIVKNRDPYVIELLKKMTGPFILRRLKSEVLSELPSKSESLVQASMEGEQRKLYLANAMLLRDQIMEQGEDAIARQRFHILAMLTKLRQICCDPGLCYDDYAGPSAKLETCMELIRESTEAGHKVLLFSQFTSMLARIEERLSSEGYSYYVLKGDTSKEQRAQMVERFNRDTTQVFLISLKAGGTGLNLIGADVVIHYDPWWNIAAQNQATDRAHRIGQKRNVQVYKLVVKDSIEEKILNLQQSKKELADAIICEQSTGASLVNMTKEDLLELLS